MLLDATGHATNQDIAKLIIEKGLAYLIALAVVVLGSSYLFVLIYRRFVRLRTQHKAEVVANGEVRERIIEKQRCQVCRLDETKSADQLAKHPLFSTIDYLLVTMVPRMPIIEPGRRLIFQDFLEIKLRKIKERFQKWLIEEIDELHEKDQELLKIEFVEVVTAIVREYEAEALRVGIPDVAVHAFAEWHKHRVAHLQREIELVMDSDWISSNVERVGYLFTVAEQITKATILDVEFAVGDLNGSLTGKTYRGVIVGPCPTRR